MEPDIDLNIREEIVRTVARLVELFNRLCQTEDGGNILLRWQPICLRQDGENRSIVRYLGDHMPRGLVFDPFLCYYRTLMESVITRKSLIREIGSRLPLQPSKRPYFYMLHKRATEVHTRDLKDIHGSRFIHSTPRRDSISPGSSIVWDSINESCRENTYQNSVVVSDDAVKKITALEDELNRLRAQIAGFVLKQDTPDATSMVPPPPPPPLAPPPPPLPTTTTVSQKTPKKSLTRPSAAMAKDGSVLDMSTILKDLNQVKLKAVERSPGGTPVRRAPRKTKATDPASIIADALKSKFAKSRMAVASPDKENLPSNSPGNSFSNTPSPQPYFRKPLEHKVNQRQSPHVEFKTHSIPLRV